MRVARLAFQPDVEILECPVKLLERDPRASPLDTRLDGVLAVEFQDLSKRFLRFLGLIHFH